MPFAPGRPGIPGKPASPFPPGAPGTPGKPLGPCKIMIICMRWFIVKTILLEILHFLGCLVIHGHLFHPENLVMILCH
jgi:hypothetical protein